MQVTWTNAGRQIDGALKYGTWNAWTQGPPDHIRARVGNPRIITAVI